jgi:biotin transport system substrate-specific component
VSVADHLRDGPDRSARHRDGTSSGYLLAYPFAAAPVGVIAGRGGDRTALRTTSTRALGVLVIYAFGPPWLTATLNVGLAKGLAVGVTPFLLGDAIKVALAAGLLPVT